MNDLAQDQADKNIIGCVKNLTREQISSHLQKVRMKEQKADELLEKLDKNGDINRMGKINAILN